MKTIILLSIILLFCGIANQLSSQSMCGTTGDGTQSLTPFKPTQSPGQNQYLRVLIVYVTFADDNEADPYNFWDPYEMPVSPNEGRSLLHTAENSSSIHFMTRYDDYTYSDYFCEMSMGQLDVIGEEILVNLPENSTWYKNNSSYNSYGKLNKFILETYVDQEVDFSDYDTWRFDGETWLWDPDVDDKVEMIIMHYRNVPDNASGWFIGSYPYSGNARLGEDGHFGTITLDGKQINETWSHDGSGITAVGYKHNYSLVTMIVQHELSHHFFGNNFRECNSPGGYGSHSRIGLMIPSHDYNSIVMTPLERSIHTVNYIEPEEVTPPNTQQFTLEDYVETGQVLKVQIPDTEEYFWIANHQKKSVYDGISRGSKQCWDINGGLQDPYCSTGKGLYIYHEDKSCTGVRCDKDFDIENADGKWNWTIDRWMPNFRPPWGDIPLFEHASSNPTTGLGEYVEVLGEGFYQQISDNKCIDNSIENDYVITLDYQGDALDAYNIGYDEIFSPYSNPGTNSCTNPTTNTGLTFQLISQSQDGSITLKIYFDDNTALTACPPSKPKNLKIGKHIINQQTGLFSPKLRWEKNRETDLTKYNIYRGVQQSCNTETEPTYNLIAYILPTSTENGYEEYIDESVDLYPQGGGSGICSYQFKSYSYKIEAVDDDNNQSVKSDRDIINGYTDPCAPDDNPVFSNNNIPKGFRIYNYPNPFNPSTDIKFELPKNTFVTVKVYNAIGEEVATLINNEFRTTGRYVIKFDGSSLASGIYFYSLSAGNFNDTKKMVLIK